MVPQLYSRGSAHGSVALSLSGARLASPALAQKTEGHARSTDNAWSPTAHARLLDVAGRSGVQQAPAAPLPAPPPLLAGAEEAALPNDGTHSANVQLLQLGTEVMSLRDIDMDILEFVTSPHLCRR